MHHIPPPLLSQMIRISSLISITSALALEFVTQGLARATSHRVLSPRGSSPRYSVPFFQNIGLDLRLADHVLQCKILRLSTIGNTKPICYVVPPEVMALRDARGELAASDGESFPIIMQALVWLLCFSCEFPWLQQWAVRQGQPNRTYKVRFLLKTYQSLQWQQFHRSHPDVAERHYPETFRKIFPNGHSGFSIAY